MGVELVYNIYMDMRKTIQKNLNKRSKKMEKVTYEDLQQEMIIHLNPTGDCKANTASNVWFLLTDNEYLEGVENEKGKDYQLKIFFMTKHFQQVAHILHSLESLGILVTKETEDEKED